MRPIRTARLLLVAVALTACSSVRDDAVPACPYCGDPVTHERADGTAEPVPRWRLSAWTPPTPDAAERR
jgi:hypothetical protein